MAAGGWVSYNIWGEGSYMGYPLTDWYPAKITPVRKGLYITGSDQLFVMMRWDGKYWRTRWLNRKVCTRISWRGVTHEVRSKGELNEIS